MSTGLTRAMRRCLEDAARAPLRRTRMGWEVDGGHPHAPGTVEALDRRGLMKINSLAFCTGGARITAAGREAVTP